MRSGGARGLKLDHRSKIKSSKIVVERGQIVKVNKDKNGIVSPRTAHESLYGLDRLLGGRFQL
jgi:hypothetical protein